MMREIAQLGEVGHRILCRLASQQHKKLFMSAQRSLNYRARPNVTRNRFLIRLAITVPDVSAGLHINYLIAAATAPQR